MHLYDENDVSHRKCLELSQEFLVRSILIGVDFDVIVEMSLSIAAAAYCAGSRGLSSSSTAPDAVKDALPALHANFIAELHKHVPELSAHKN